jgi:hypothetical protein
MISKTHRSSRDNRIPMRDAEPLTLKRMTPGSVLCMRHRRPVIEATRYRHSMTRNEDEKRLAGASAIAKLSYTRRHATDCALPPHADICSIRP